MTPPLLRPDDAPDTTDYAAEINAQADQLLQDEMDRLEQNKRDDRIMRGIGWLYLIAALAGAVWLARWLLLAPSPTLAQLLLPV